MSAPKTCHGCGNEVVLLMAGGRLRPTGCACDPALLENVRGKDDFCRPSKCPQCGAGVYFLLHDGGSVWLDGPIAWPWPLHGCFAGGPAAAEFARAFHNRPRGALAVCRVAAVLVQPAARDRVLILNHLDNRTTVWKTKDDAWDPAPASLASLHETIGTLMQAAAAHVLAGPCQRCRWCNEWFTRDEMPAHDAAVHGK